jgi:formylglycine-generating enzyme required for sulfatase activity
MGALPPIAELFRGDDLPVSNASWIDVGVFCEQLSEESGSIIRLPSEVEWEYACRAGTATPFHWGPTLTASVANFNAEHTYGLARPGEFRHCLTDVGSFGVSNAFGLYDMHGNVWEWCEDAWHDDYCGAPNDASAWCGQVDEGYRVQRGGSWRDRPELCRSAFRVGDIIVNSDHIVGLRICTNAGPN